MVSPLSRPLSIASLGWSPSTPAGGVKGEVVVVSDVSAEKLKDARPVSRQDRAARHAQSPCGRDVQRRCRSWMRPGRYSRKPGVLAVVMTDREKNNVLNAHDMLWGAKLLPLPGARDRHGRRQADPERTGTRSGRHPDGVGEPDVRARRKVNNVVAEIRGQRTPG